jgi:hypothetical protein
MTKLRTDNRVREMKASFWSLTLYDYETRSRLDVPPVARDSRAQIQTSEIDGATAALVGDADITRGGLLMRPTS